MATIQQVKKRNGEVVDFDPAKITIAVHKAFTAVRGKADEERTRQIANSVVADIEKMFTDRVPSVENVQDFVERAIMLEGFFDVAKAYIIYRYEHTKEREEKKQDVIRKIEAAELSVVKRSGTRETFSLEKIRHTIQRAAQGLDGVDTEALVMQCRTEVYDNITTAEISRAILMTARAFIERDPAYSKLATRFLFSLLYREVIGMDKIDFQNLDAQYRTAFVDNIKKGVTIGKLDPKMLEYDLEAMSQKLVLERDDMLLYLGAQTLYDRYFLQDYDRHVLETPQAMWMRVAMGLALNEGANAPAYAERFYHMISTLRFVPSTPTLFHAGTAHPQLSSCYLNTVADSLDEIFKSYADNAQLSKWSGGIGTDWTSVRGTGAPIKGTGVESQGVIPFLKIANDTVVAINRSGRRRGAACVYLETWHYDIEDFLELRKNTGDERRRTHDMDTASWIPDLFMKRVREDGDWTLFSSNEVPDLHETYGKDFETRYGSYERMADEGKMHTWKRMKARDLWKKMLAMLFETGHPWITFKDPSNVRSPQDHAGVIHSSNLCTEITLNTSSEETAVCNLGSVNLAQHLDGKRLATERLEETVEVAMRMLDNVIDVNFYPTKEAKTSNMRHRPVGMGIMGFQDALYALDINFDSEACVEFADSSMEVIAYHAYLASSKLAAERGAYESFKGSKWDRGILPQDTIALLEAERGERIPVPRTERLDWRVVRESIKQYGMRNSNCLAIAPTATISNISGCIPTIEPIYKNIYVKSNVSGDFIVVNSYLVEDLKQIGLWSADMLSKIKYFDGNIEAIDGIPQHIKEKYKETFQINPKWLIKSAAYRGRWIDQSQSLNIYFKGASGKDLSEVYQYAWELGLKTTYYLRTLAASQVEKSTVNAAEFGATHNRKDSMREESPAVSAPVVAAAVAMEPSRTTVVAEAVVAMERQPVAVVVGSKPIPLCKIDDPNCESCQ